ncbi:hypothetical protein [Pseudovibrio sp. Ad37]|uniref:hypothetical protein n=1 Tax=Pseudovibrio sp. Ad37 TaxID=989422 RepID=UPI0007AECB93|nr:hypothetical protein [Pseudovibrio sp. Ad37]KZL12975.1 hypothetical protein PsAD37_05470 [Pseudovibrio sp. Ad37]
MTKNVSSQWVLGMALLYILIGFIAHNVFSNLNSLSDSIQFLIVIGALDVIIPGMFAAICVVVFTVKKYGQVFSENQLYNLAVISTLLEIPFYWLIAIIMYPSEASFSEVMAQWGAIDNSDAIAIVAILMFLFTLFIAMLLRWLALRISTWLVLKFVRVEEAESIS